MRKSADTQGRPLNRTRNIQHSLIDDGNDDATLLRMEPLYLGGENDEDSPSIPSSVTRSSNLRGTSSTRDCCVSEEENSAAFDIYTPDSALHNAANSGRHCNILGVQVDCGWRLFFRLLFVTFFVGIMVAGFVVCVVLGYVNIFLEFVSKLGIWGMVIIALAFAAMAYPFFFGYILLGIGTGLLYNWWGLIPMSIGSAVGAATAFWVLKFFFRGWTERQIQKSPKFKAVFDSVGENGIKIAFLIRYLPIPFGIQNALLSVSSISFWKFLLGTALGQFPEQIACVWIGTTLHTFSDLVNGGVSDKNKILLGVDVVMIIVLIFVLFWIGRRALKSVNQKAAEQAGLLDEEMGLTAEEEDLDTFPPASPLSSSPAALVAAGRKDLQSSWDSDEDIHLTHIAPNPHLNTSTL